MSDKLDGMSRGRDNNLNLIRAVAAILVLVSHSFPITMGALALEPLEEIFGKSLGWLSVAIFFVISGFLISKSYDRRPSSMHWLSARILRLYPALIVVIALTVLVLGPLVTSLPLGEYFTSGRFYTYILRNILLAHLQYDLPGVFENNPYPLAINGSLWTLFYEIVCYGGVFAIGIFGAYNNNRKFAACFILYILLYVIASALAYEDILHPKLMALKSLSFPFFIGVIFYQYRKHIKISIWIVLLLGLAAFASFGTLIFLEVFILFVSYSVLWLAYVPSGFIRRFNELGDYSYGIYIYAFPIQQLVVYAFGTQNWYENVMYAMPLTLLFAIASWHLLEKYALAQSKPLAQRWLDYSANRSAGRVTIDQ